MEDPSGWSLTESDPQVFSELLRNLGVQGLQVDDLYSLDADTLERLKPIHALIFLFKWVGQGGSDDAAGLEIDPAEAGVWFANQVINNSCGTIAALNAVMNIPEQEAGAESIGIGAELKNLREFGAGMSSMDLGHVVASSDTIREVHNSFSKTSPFALDASADEREKEDAYHFVTYLPKHGVLYELDGLRSAPLMHAACDDDWLTAARETIEARIATYPPGSVMFNLLAVRSAAIPRLERELAAASGEMERLRITEMLAQERAKAQEGAVENALRRHNMLPLVLGLFEALNASSIKAEVIDAAREKAKARKAQAAARGQKE
ncbi:putative ubiquitin-specific protease [Cutaneotrichosporon oleaginosum]|uniref:Ubiquitin carboxyl-terminal hydrolase n=1 Tax=Cutaneotrichosporon oleaginosum TaxID=879819 RepID=A0A0J0XUT2_9TREE|nr:putative ubiquitin-specific protease [Cutaneotrichosporon oleaginosum]KLT44807.1 putative ubiquitin-specific protease [Cutaneotrichosporon oleaginosum]TXT11946.1 hypothetical protein COLE_02356 [Cutaneotrichosporon oleaginosum]